MHDGVVDAGSPGGGAGDEAHSVALSSEIVEGERFFSGVDEVGHGIRVVEGKNRQDGAEYLFLHERRVGRRRIDEGGSDEAFRRVVCSAPYDAFRLVVDIALQPCEGPLADDAGPGGAAPEILAVETDGIRFDFVEQRFLHVAVYEKVVGGDAGLAGVQELAPCDFACRNVEVGRAVYDAGAFAAEFERDGGQMRRRLLHDRAAERGAAREENVVEAVFEQFGGFVVAAVEDRDVFRREDLLDEFPYQAAGVCRGRGGFQRHAVARSQGPDQRVERELERVVPRCHDEHDTFRFADDAARRGKEKERGTHPPAPRTAVHVAELVADFGQHDARFGEVGLFGRFVQVGVQCGRNLLFAGPDRIVESVQVPFSECGIPRMSFGVESFQCAEPFLCRCCHRCVVYGASPYPALRTVAFPDFPVFAPPCPFVPPGACRASCRLLRRDGAFPMRRPCVTEQK